MSRKIRATQNPRYFRVALDCLLCEEEDSNNFIFIVRKIQAQKVGESRDTRPQALGDLQARDHTQTQSHRYSHHTQSRCVRQSVLHTLLSPDYLCGRKCSWVGKGLFWELGGLDPSPGACSAHGPL